MGWTHVKFLAQIDWKNKQNNKKKRRKKKYHIQVCLFRIEKIKTQVLGQNMPALNSAWNDDFISKESRSQVMSQNNTKPDAEVNTLIPNNAFSDILKEEMDSSELQETF